MSGSAAVEHAPEVEQAGVLRLNQRQVLSCRLHAWVLRCWHSLGRRTTSPRMAWMETQAAVGPALGWARTSSSVYFPAAAAAPPEAAPPFPPAAKPPSAGGIAKPLPGRLQVLPLAAPAGTTTSTGLPDPSGGEKRSVNGGGARSAQSLTIRERMVRVAFWGAVSWYPAGSPIEEQAAPGASLRPPLSRYGLRGPVPQPAAREKGAASCRLAPAKPSAQFELMAARLPLPTEVDEARSNLNVQAGLEEGKGTEGGGACWVISDRSQSMA